MDKKFLIVTHVYGIQESSTGEPIYREEMETQIQRMDLWTQRGEERLGEIARVALTQVGNCYVTQRAQQALCDDLDEWNVEQGRLQREGRYIYNYD